MNIDADSPESAGVEGLVQNYRSAKNKIKFCPKSYLAPTLKSIKDKINKRGQIYNVILVFVAGPVLDIDDAKELIVEMSHYPCQFIVIGMLDEACDQFEDLN